MQSATAGAAPEVQQVCVFQGWWGVEVAEGGLDGVHKDGLHCHGTLPLAVPASAAPTACCPGHLSHLLSLRTPSIPRR